MSKPKVKRHVKVFTSLLESGLYLVRKVAMSAIYHTWDGCVVEAGCVIAQGLQAQDGAWHAGTVWEERRICKTRGSWKGLQEEMRKGLICQQSLQILSPGQ